MKFYYCPECKDLRPKSWYNRGKCLLCGRECTTVVIPMSIYGYLMYALSTVGATMLAFELMGTDLGLGESRLYIMFGALILALIFSFLELERTTWQAKEKIGKVL